ncbi:MAG: DUF1987 domain-containing protein [Bacteroidales bacterium]|nr:DUF1987 domain-containing protein [Bacteroidales bacterium]
MDPLRIEKELNTLKIVLDKNKNEFLFEGRSLPENTVKFFEPVMAWIKNYKNDPLEETIVHMNFIYFNTSSAKLLLEILREFDEINKSGKPVKIYWHYMVEDFDILEAGEEYSTMISTPFEYIEHPEEDYTD